MRVALLSLLLVAACAHSPERLDRVGITDQARADPWEQTNRNILRFNEDMDRVAVRPITKAYRAAVPRGIREMARNGFRHVREPSYFANAVLQGKFDRAFRALDRILINTLLGFGVTDPATDMGLPVMRHDFGQTLAVWGVPSGPYLMLPFFGPSTARDGFGFVIDFLFDPFDFAENRLLSREERLVRLGFRVIDIRSGLMDQGEQFLAGAADPYATIRSAWLQTRRFELHDGTPPELDAEEEDWDPPILDDPEGPVEAPPDTATDAPPDVEGTP